MSRPVYLGKLMLHWCHQCNVPVLGEICDTCKKNTLKVTITPPGDIRPAFSYDISLINKISTKQFGVPLIPDDRVVILNKAPYDDRMEEIIIDGKVIGNIRFEIERLDWVLLLRPSGAKILFEGRNLKSLKNWVMVDDTAVPFIVNGASVLAPGIIDCDNEIIEGNEVIVVSRENNVVAGGRSKMKGSEMISSEYGVGVKTRWNGANNDTSLLKKETKWSDVIKANEAIMEKYTQEAYNFINNTIKNIDKPICISYSGGKDSLVLMQLLNECLEDFDILFADTGLEFPETLDNVEKVAKCYDKNLISTSAGNSFWESFPAFGPPTVESRWCCKICKLGPISSLIENNFEDGCLTFIGQRKYESSARAKSSRVWKNPWVVNQIAAAPIQNWTALHVWLYLLKTKAPYNPLYEQGYDRIGCWLCPSSSLSELMRLKDTHPHLEEQFMNQLVSFAESRGLSKKWVRHGMWRWEKPPQNIRKSANNLGISLVQKNSSTQDLNFKITSGYRPCKDDVFSAEGSFGIPLNIEDFKDNNLLSACGVPLYIDGAVIVKNKGINVQIFASGTITVQDRDEKKALSLIKDAKNSVIRSLKCQSCGICVRHCPNKALNIAHNGIHIKNNCEHCSKCIYKCPVIKFNK